MLCLRCGHCCRTMSPIVGDLCACPHLEGEEGEVCSCAVYDRRPEQCAAHEYAAWSVCPIGRDVLGVHDASHLAAREHRIAERAEA